MFQIFITEATVQTLSLITILFLQLYQRLTIRRTDNRKPGITPRTDNMIALRLQFFQKTSGTFTHSFICLVQTIGIRKGTTVLMTIKSLERSPIVFSF